jgi:DNA-binding ferritin-like protein
MTLDSNVNLFLGLLAQLKVIHWQTKGFARHEAFDKTYGELNELVDDFMEQAMGKYGRFKLSDETNTITLSNLSELKPEQMVSTVVEALIQYTNQFDSVDTNLLNLRDEMLGLLYKLSYLLTLE